MKRTLGMAGLALGTVFLNGCVTLYSGPLTENPVFVRPDPTIHVENPIFVPQGPWYYNAVFDKVVGIVEDYFEIATTNRYAGTIRTYPRIAPGLEQPWKSGNPDLYDRLLATLQTIRHRAEIRIEPAKDGGYFLEVVVYRELEDAPRPIRALSGSASFQAQATVERQFEVIDPTVYEAGWVPLGRNTALEQLILQRIKGCL
jgi:hypothetical protein